MIKMAFLLNIATIFVFKKCINVEVVFDLSITFTKE